MDDKYQKLINAQSTVRLISYLVLSIFILTKSRYLVEAVAVGIIVFVIMTFVSVRANIANLRKNAGPRRSDILWHAILKSKYDIIFLAGLVIIFVTLMLR